MMVWTLYRCYDATGQLLYVGVTRDLRMRMRLHATTSEWAQSVARTSETYYQTRCDALLDERRATLTESPRYPSEVTGPTAHASARSGVAADLRHEGVPVRECRARAAEIVASSGYLDDAAMTPATPGVPASAERDAAALRLSLDAVDEFLRPAMAVLGRSA